MNAAALEPPRWKNGPPICTAVNLPAFETEKALHDFHGQHTCTTVKAKWHCAACGRWHAKTGEARERA
jgi:hypothetical protein